MNTKFLGIVLTMFFVGSFVGMASATMLGAPVSKGEQGKKDLGIGVSFWKKQFEMDDFDDSGDIRGTRLLITPAFSVADQVDVFLRFGMVDSELDFEDDDAEIKTDMTLAYGGGIKFTFLDAARFRVGAMLQLLLWSGDDEVFIDGLEYEIDIDSFELDAAVGAEYAINDDVSCFGGFMLGKADADLEISQMDTITLDASEKNFFGLFGGVNYNITDALDVGFETRLITEMSFTLFADFSF